MDNRERKNEIKVRLSDDELRLLHAKMEAVNARSREWFLRHLIVYGFVYEVDRRERNDDGYTGIHSVRPAFQQMLRDVEDGKIGCVITKDLSRLARNYLESGTYIEIFFPQHDVRYIAINDGEDSVNGSAEITPFKNILNEFYSRDVSKKVKSGKPNRMKRTDAM